MIIKIIVSTLSTILFWWLNDEVISFFGYTHNQLCLSANFSTYNVFDHHIMVVGVYTILLWCLRTKIDHTCQLVSSIHNILKFDDIIQKKKNVKYKTECRIDRESSRLKYRVHTIKYRLGVDISWDFKIFLNLAVSSSTFYFIYLAT